MWKQLLEKRSSQMLASIIALCRKLLTVLCCALNSINELDLELTVPTKNTFLLLWIHHGQHTEEFIGSWYSLNKKGSKNVFILEHLVPGCWKCLGRIRGHALVGDASPETRLWDFKCLCHSQLVLSLSFPYLQNICFQLLPYSHACLLQCSLSW